MSSSTLVMLSFALLGFAGLSFYAASRSFKKKAENDKIPNRPKCSLAGVKLEKLSIIDYIKRTLIAAQQEEKAIEFEKRALAMPSINKLIDLADEYVDRWK